MKNTFVSTENILSLKKGKKILIWDKNVILFLRRINGKLYFLHRIKADIQIISVYDLNEPMEGI